MKRLFYLLLFSAAVIVTVLSCKDDFNEEDFLKLQSDLRLKQDSISRRRNKAATDTLTEETVKEYVKAANAAGDLMAVTLLVREDGNPLPGVAVSMNISPKNALSSGRESSTQATISGTTDANGMVTFDKVVIGAGTIQFSKSGYISSTATVDFGTPSQPRSINVTDPNTGRNITKYLAPEKRFEEAPFQMFSTTPTEGSTATIKGKVTIQNDLTNLIPEVPANIVIRANLASLQPQTPGFVSSYQLMDNTTLGVATLAANGDYTMTVPATSAGQNITLVIPNIEGTCRMAVKDYDDGTGTAVPLPNGPEYRDVPTSWGPQAPAGQGTTVPAVVGAKVVFDQPPVAGTELSFNFTKVPRSLPSGYAWNQASATMGVQGFAPRITDRGQYSAGPCPTIDITNGGGTEAKARAVMRSYVSSITVNNRGNYAGQLVPIDIVITDNTGTDIPLGYTLYVGTVNSQLPATIDLSTFGQTDGFMTGNQIPVVADQVITTNYPAYQGLKLVVNGGVGGGLVTGTFKTELEGVIMTAGGSGYTSKPTFTFKGGGLPDGDSKHADTELVDMEVEWTITPNNMVATTYPIMPSDISIVYPGTQFKGISSGSSINVYSLSGILETPNPENIINHLTLSAGKVVEKNPARSLRTLRWSCDAELSAKVITVEPKESKATFTGAFIDDITGKILGFATKTNGAGYNTKYTAMIAPSIATAPGTGATVALDYQYNPLTFEYQWGPNTGYTITNPGSGYLPNLNRQGVAPSSFFVNGSPAPQVVSGVQPGKTYIFNIDYGTGNRKVKVN